MTVFVVKRENSVLLMVRAEGPGAIGDLSIEVTPGRSGLGKTYDEWMAVEADSVEID